VKYPAISGFGNTLFGCRLTLELVPSFHQY
jgi:hypothetical protein